MHQNNSNVQNGLPASGLEWNSATGQLLEDESEPALSPRRAEEERLVEEERLERLAEEKRFGEPTPLEQAVSNNPNASPAASSAADRVKKARECCLKAITEGRMTYLPHFEAEVGKFSKRLESQLQMEGNEAGYWGGSNFTFIQSPRVETPVESAPEAEPEARKEPSLLARIRDEIAARLKFTAVERDRLNDGWTEAEILGQRALDAEKQQQLAEYETKTRAQDDARWQAAKQKYAIR